MRPLGERLGQYINYVVSKYQIAISNPKNMTLPRVKNQALYIATPPSNMIKLQPMINKVVDLGVMLVELVFVSIYLLLVSVTELFVLATCGK